MSKLTRQSLLEVFSEETIQASTYTIQARTLIRLINTKPENASVKALYPNTRQYREAFRYLDNVNFRVHDTKDGTLILNTKTDMEVIEDFPELPKIGE